LVSYFGTIKDIAKITMTEKQALVKQIKDLARGGRDAKVAIKKAKVELVEALKNFKRGGKISTTQEVAILNRFAKLNVLSDMSVKKFTDYMTKVFSDAEYSNQLSKANKERLSIRKLSKDKTKNANLTDLGKKFYKIDPSMVDNIYEYNEMASKVSEAINGSKIRGKETKFADTVNIDDVIEFTNKAIENQDKKLRQEKIEEIRDLLDLDSSSFTPEEIDALFSSFTPEQIDDLLKENKSITKDDEKIIRASVNKAFDTYSTMIKETIETGEDPFSGEEVEFSEKQKELIKRFMDMDLNNLSPKEALLSVDALHNFLVNKSTAKMESVLADYEGRTNIKELVKDKFKATKLQKLFSENLGESFI